LKVKKKNNNLMNNHPIYPDYMTHRKYSNVVQNLYNPYSASPRQ
jgi:hypothetical protein